MTVLILFISVMCVLIQRELRLLRKWFESSEIVTEETNEVKLNGRRVE